MNFLNIQHWETHASHNIKKNLRIGIWVDSILTKVRTQLPPYFIEHKSYIFNTLSKPQNGHNVKKKGKKKMFRRDDKIHTLSR